MGTVGSDLAPGSPELVELKARHTLSDVITWGRAVPGRTASPLVITNVIIQDEFTHDAIVPLRDDLVVVFGST